jgi:ribosomal protein S18 acetylase RimI-like enzyme
MIEYRDNVRPDARVIAELYAAAPLIRPVQDHERIAKMAAGANILQTAWDGERLAGILRGWTDGVFDGYICDLAVHPDFQRHGVGRELLERTRTAFPKVQFVLRASRIATDYYRHLGWEKMENGWFWPRPPW